MRKTFIVIMALYPLIMQAKNYEDPFEAFFVGAISTVILSVSFFIIKWMGRGVKNVTKSIVSSSNDDKASQNVTPADNIRNLSDDNLSTSTQQSQSKTSVNTQWKVFKTMHYKEAISIESIANEDFQNLNQNDISEIVSTFKRWSANLNCEVSEIRETIMKKINEELSESEIKKLISLAKEKMEEESRSYGVSPTHTISFYMSEMLNRKYK